MQRKQASTKPLTDQEREWLANQFDDMRAKLLVLHERCKGIGTAYPGFAGDNMYDALTAAVYSGFENADGLADYIRVATSEHWESVEPLGVLGGVIDFPADHEFKRQEG